MNRPLLSFILFFLISAVKAQETRITIVPSHSAQEIVTYTPQQEYEMAAQLPKGNTGSGFSISSLADANNPALSAEASSAIRFKDIPVNLATGAMYLPIPLYTLSEGMLSVPVSIDFNGSGMKNQEVASWCGAGWNLTAGGMITRMVRGLPDEGAKYNGTDRRGYFKFGFGGNGTSVDNDTEPDIFYLNINGQTHKMIYRYNGENARFEFFPDSDIKIIPTFQFLSGSTTVGRFTKFEVVLPNGVHYIFGNNAVEATVEAEAGYIQSAGNYPGTSGFTNFWNDNAQTSVWYLTKIISPYGQEINFNYDQVRYSYYRIADHGVDKSQTLQAVCPDPTDVDKEINRVFVKTVSLTSIIGINTKIEFNKRYRVCNTQYDYLTGEYIEICNYVDPSNPRIDIDQWERYPQNSSGAKRLNEMMVMENSSSPQDTLFYQFSYGHFFGVNNDLPSGYSEFNSAHTLVGYTHQRRLRLEEIGFPDQTNVRFRYKGDHPTYNGKSRLDFGIDHWGYANGRTGNRNLTGLIPKDEDYPNCTASTSYRDTDSTFSFYGSMDSIVYSGGKTIAFEYETHTARNYTDTSGNYKPIGGPRIKRITRKDQVSGIETKKEYDYSLNGETTGHLALHPTYRYKTPFLEEGTNSSIYDRLLAEIGRPPVVYGRVSEVTLDSSNQGLGKTVYYFDDDTTDLRTFQSFEVCYDNEYPYDSCEIKEYIRPELVKANGTGGQWGFTYQAARLVKTETFNEAGDTLAVQTWNYSPYAAWNGRQTAAAKVFRVNNKTIGYTSYSGGTFTQQYNLLNGRYRLKGQASTLYSQSGTNPLTTSVSYIYKDEMPGSYKTSYPGEHNQLVKTETTDSRGRLIEQYIRYPADFNFVDTSIYVSQTCYDSLGPPYECGYTQYISAVPPSGSQARGLFEFKDNGLWAYPVESKNVVANRLAGATYNTIEAFEKSSGFNYAYKKTFSSGHIGSTLSDMQYDKVTNDTIYTDNTYLEISRVEGYNDFGLPESSKGFGGAVGRVNFDSSGVLIADRIQNPGGVFVDSVQVQYDKRLFGASRVKSVNHLETITRYDTTFRKGMVKEVLDKDGYLLGHYDQLQPGEAGSLGAITTDSSKYRMLSRMPRTATNSLPANLDSLDSQISYYDAEGRLLQNKAINSSPDHTDLTLSNPQYDSFGRPLKSLLPIATGDNSGGFTNNVLSSAQSFYGDSSPFSEVSDFEDSPLSRVFKSIAPGASFRPGKEAQQSYETGSFGILRRNVDLSGFYHTQSYSGEQIARRVNTDEDGNKVIEYADKEGRLLESHIQYKGDGSSTSDYLKTTMLYDDLGRQVAAIPPALYDSVPDSTYLLASSFIDHIYYTKFDDRGRAVETHVPDAGWSYRVFNRLGQLVMMQNARQRETNQWEWIKYDARGNKALSGIVTNSTYSRSSLQDQFDDFTDSTQYEERSTAGGNVESYTAHSFPAALETLLTSSGTVMTANYYDDYGWNSDTTLHFQEYKTSWWPNSKGLLTGTKVRNLSTNEWLASTFYYDDKNRLIQTQSKNRYGQVNQTDHVYDFIGQLLETRTIYQTPSETVPLEISTAYTHDHAGRVLDAVHTLNSNPELLASYQYDEIGRLIQKNLNESRIDSIVRQNDTLATGIQDQAAKYVLLQPGVLIDSSNVYVAYIAGGLQRVSYGYDLQGNLTCINCDTTGNLDSSKVFAMKLDYFQDGRYYNGVLSKQTWLTSASSATSSYLYDYDKSNRILAADFQSDTTWNYDVRGIAYDANGNIQSLNRFGQTDSTSWGKIDSLAYTYDTHSNRLSAIDDYANDSLGFGNVTGSNEYSYYSDGSLKTDGNKGITNIIYNYLGLPDEVQFGAGKKIKNIYTSDGQKLSTWFINGSDTLKKDYVGDLIYENGALVNIFHDEGRIQVTQDTTIHIDYDTLTFDHDTLQIISRKYDYQYLITDHLGNTRVVFQKLNDSIYIAQSTDYYLFGAPFHDDNLSFSFLFQGKEYVDAFGYNAYDFHARQYDAYSGRFMSIDPKNQFTSGYTGMGNTPTTGVDPDGQLFFFIPQIGWSKKGGLNLGLEVGVGFPGALSASITGGYNFGSKEGYWSGQGYAAGFYGGYGTNGNFAGWGFKYGGLSAGVSFGKSGLGAGINYGFGNGYNSGVLGVGWSESNGLDFSLSASSIFLFGSANSYMSDSPENKIKGDTPVDFTAKSVQELYQTNFKDIDLSNTTFYAIDKQTLASQNGDAIAQTRTTFRGQKAIRFQMLFSRSAFASKEQLAFSLVHELGHVIHNKSGLNILASEKVRSSGLLNNEGHVAIQTMTFDFLITNGWNYKNFSQATNFIGTSPYPALLDPIRILNRKIR